MENRLTCLICYVGNYDTIVNKKTIRGHQVFDLLPGKDASTWGDVIESVHKQILDDGHLLECAITNIIRLDNL